MSASGLQAKKLAVMAQVSYVEKDGTHPHYKYVSAANVVATVRKALINVGLTLTPVVQSVELAEYNTAKGAHTFCATVTLGITLHDPETGESETMVMVGQGTDQGDKATYMAVTGAFKYALTTMFMLQSFDDPEANEQTDTDPISKPVQPKRTKKELAAHFGAVMIKVENHPGVKELAHALQMNRGQLVEAHDAVEGDMDTLWDALNEQVQAAELDGAFKGEPDPDREAKG